MKETQLLNTNIKVVPLLETIEDLNNGPVILDSFLQHPITQQRASKIDRKQEVMLGYSDSNKDGEPLQVNGIYIKQSRNFIKLVIRTILIFISFTEPEEPSAEEGEIPSFFRKYACKYSKRNDKDNRSR